jgi:hypothetical protein
VGAFLITSEGSAAAGIRRIEAVTGRGAYDLIVRRFKTLKQTAGLLKSSVDEVPHKVVSLQDEIADLRKELAGLRRDTALITFSTQLENVKETQGVKVLITEVPNADVDTLRSLADKFRERYPQNGAAVLGTGTTLIAVRDRRPGQAWDESGRPDHRHRRARRWTSQLGAGQLARWLEGERSVREHRARPGRKIEISLTAPGGFRRRERAQIRYGSKSGDGNPGGTNAWKA